MASKISIPLEPLELTQRYKLLTSLVIPRPIAWISTQSKDGVTNLAPFSFFNVFGSNPPLVIICQGNRPGTDDPKDTPTNIIETGTFVINLLGPELAEAMNASAADLPKGESEIETLGLNTSPAKQIQVPMISDCPANLECKLIEIRQYGGNRLVIGEVLEVHLDSSIYDAEHNYILPNYQPIGKLGGNQYSTTATRIEIQRPH